MIKYILHRIHWIHILASTITASTAVMCIAFTNHITHTLSSYNSTWLSAVAMWLIGLCTNALKAEEKMVEDHLESEQPQP